MESPLSRLGWRLLIVGAILFLIGMAVEGAEPPNAPPIRVLIDFRLPADLRLEREEVAPAAVPFGGNSVTPTPARSAAPTSTLSSGSFPAASTGTFARPAVFRGITDCPT